MPRMQMLVSDVEMPARPGKKMWRRMQRLFKRVMHDEDIAAGMLQVPSDIAEFYRLTGQYSEQTLERELADVARLAFHAILIKKSYGLQLMESDKEGTIKDAQIKSALTSAQVNTLAVIWDSEMKRVGMQGMDLCDDWMLDESFVRRYLMHVTDSDYGDAKRMKCQSVAFEHLDTLDAVEAMLARM